MTTDGADATDLIRWTFQVDPAAADRVRDYLEDQGADVFILLNGTFHVTWDEPEVGLDPVVEAIWAIAGAPFEITQEEFHRLALHVLQHEPDAVDDHDAPSLNPSGTTEVFHPAVESLEIKEL